MNSPSQGACLRGDQTSPPLTPSVGGVERIERLRTDCLYPSFEQVEVVIFRVGNVIRVSDDGGAARSAWIHGQEGAHVSAAIRAAALHYGAETDGGEIHADAPTDEWKRSAVLAVANASAQAANAALSGSAPQVAQPIREDLESKGEA